MPTLINLPRFRAMVREHKSVPADVFIRKELLTKIEEIGERTLRFTISTAAVDREDDSVAVDGWELTAYRQNPVVLWSHKQCDLPVGRATSIDIEGDALKATVEFVDPSVPIAGPFAEAVLQLLKNGFLNAASVAFRPLECEETSDPARGAGGWLAGIDFRRQELLEFSIVTVPCNPEALIDPGQQIFDDADAIGPNESVSPQADGLEEERTMAEMETKRARVNRSRMIRRLQSGC